MAATWYASGTYSFDVNLTDGNAHQFALYAIDYDNSGRSQRIDIVDTATGSVLDSRTMSGFAAGQYLIWNLSGHLTIQLTQLGGPNAVASGLFFDVPAQAPNGSTAFVRLDTSTQGTWKATYGADGYDFAAASPSLPSYAQVTVNGVSSYTWAASTTDIRGAPAAQRYGPVRGYLVWIRLVQLRRQLHRWADTSARSVCDGLRQFGPIASESTSSIAHRACSSIRVPSARFRRVSTWSGTWPDTSRFESRFSEDRTPW